MAALFAKTFCKMALQDVARQYEHPIKSISGALLTRLWARKSRPLEEFTVAKLDFSPDDNVLEIGYGRGDGLSAVYERVASGKGTVFGLERSDYMEETARKRFILEITEQDKIHLDRAVDLGLLPYPSDFFGAAFHVNAFYFWKQERMPDILWELARILRPGAQLLCAVDPEQLKKLYKWETLTESQSNILRYASLLESVGFVNVKVEYHPVRNSEIQLISAQKSEKTDDEDPDARMKKLEDDIKQFMLSEFIRQKSTPGAMKQNDSRKPSLDFEQ